jgi:hypothetical protein
MQVSLAAASLLQYVSNSYHGVWSAIADIHVGAMSGAAPQSLVLCISNFTCCINTLSYIIGESVHMAYERCVQLLQLGYAACACCCYFNDQ